jgi:hypothetical protein
LIGPFVFKYFISNYIAYILPQNSDALEGRLVEGGHHLFHTQYLIDKESFSLPGAQYACGHEKRGESQE